MQYADIVVPRGAENRVAMQLIVHHVKNQLEKVQETNYYACLQVVELCRSRCMYKVFPFLLQRGFNFRSKLIMDQPNGDKLPDSVYILPNKAQVKGMHTVIR